MFEKGASFYQLQLQDDDYEILFKFLEAKPYDIVIDLTTDTNCFKIVEAVKKFGLHYMNTALEINWHFQDGASAYDQSLYKRHIILEELHKKVKDEHNATHVYEFGMNPGLISHFVLQALTEISNEVLKVNKDEKLKEFLDAK